MLSLSNNRLLILTIFSLCHSAIGLSRKQITPKEKIENQRFLTTSFNNHYTRGRIMNSSVNINLSPRELLALHLSISSHALLNQSYSNLLLSQQLLTSQLMDPALTVKVKAYQNQLRQQAHAFKQSTMSELIGLFTKASNFSTLVNTINKLYSIEDPRVPQQTAEQIAALADVALSYQNAAQAVDTQFSVTRETLEPLMNNFCETVDAIEQGLSAEAKQQAQTITKLNEAIGKNIQGIVDAGIKAGEGVVQLGQSIVAAVPLEPAKDTPPTQPKTATEQVNYMISGIQAISAGASGAHQAVSDLKANYVKLAAAYQALARANALLSVAKSVHAQAQLFADTYALIAQHVALLPIEWNKVAQDYQATASVIRTVGDMSEMKQIQQVISLSADQWQRLSKVIGNAKSNYAGNNILPEV
ncbi:hypothetical protein [Serratia inhibens]